MTLPDFWFRLLDRWVLDYERLAQSQLAAKLLPLLGAVAAAAFHDTFAKLAGIFCVLVLMDWVAARRHYREVDKYDATKSRRGLVEKGMQLCVLMVLRSFEHVALRGSTGGIIASGLISGLIVLEFESIDRHLAHPIPYLSAAVKKISRATGGDTRSRHEERQRERRGSQPEGTPRDSSPAA